MSEKPKLDPTAYQWLTTAQAPWAPNHGNAQKGWSVHAVLATPETKLADVRNVSALCGLLPAHGWGMDLFIERECRRCLRKLGVCCLACRGAGMVRASETRYEDCNVCRGVGRFPYPSTSTSPASTSPSSG